MPMYGGTQGWKHTGSIDWNAVSVEGRKTPDEGLYECRVVKAEPKASSTDKPMISVQIELTGAEEEHLREFVGSKVYDNWLLDQEGAFRIKNFCVVTGVELPENVEFDTIREFCENLIGQETKVMLRQQTYQGKARAQVEFYGEEPPKDEERPKPSAKKPTAKKK